MLEKPRCFEEGYVYLDVEKEEWRIKDDAPDWAKEEFEEFQRAINPSPNEDGLVVIS